MDLKQRNVGKYSKAPAGEQVIPRFDLQLSPLGDAVLDGEEFDPASRTIQYVRIVK